MVVVRDLDLRGEISTDRSHHERAFDSEPEKFVETKNARTLLAVIDGIRDPERAEAYVRAAGECDRTGPRIVGAAFQRARTLRDGQQRGESE